MITLPLGGQHGLDSGATGTALGQSLSLTMFRGLKTNSKNISHELRKPNNEERF